MKPRDAFFRPMLGLWVMLHGVCLSAEEQPAPFLNQGISAYESGDYEAAVNRFKSALLKSPDDSVVHHWLGKSYGRVAEKSSFLKAMTYSRKTLKHFQRAVALDRHNHAATRDLITYYEAAPAIAGGDEKEARRLSARLQAMENATRRADKPDNQENQPDPHTLPSL